MARRITIRTNILTNILAVVSVVAAALLALQYYYAKTLVIESTENRFRLMGDGILRTLEGRDRLIRQSLEILSVDEGLQRFNGGKDPRRLVRLLSAPMRRDSNLYAAYLGYPGGELFEVVNLASAADLRNFYRVPSAARWLLIRIHRVQGNGWVRRFDAYDGNYERIGSREEPSDYRVTRRPWYLQALGKRTIVRSEPYLFYNLRQTGITYSLETERDGVVLAIDTTTREMDQVFRELKFAPRSEVVLLGKDRVLIASSEGRHGVISHGIYRKLIAEGTTGKVVAYQRDGERYLAMVIPFEQGGSASPWWLGLSIDEATMIAPYVEVLSRELAMAMVVLLLMLPLVRFTTGRIVRPIHALMRENEKVRRRRFDEVERIETEIIELDRLSRSLVEMSESIREYQESQKRLLDAFIRLIAGAIDAKSPYTGGHCKRVPILARRLLEEADRSREGELAEFRLEGEEAWEEFERGAWLHDCGKITTPEYVVDKATKLETIHNRIHEVRTRFEVLWRDAEIRYYEGLLAGGDRERLERELRREHADLLEEFDFIARVNIGGEFLDGESRERIGQIARRTWLRHFDDRLGLSEEERRRMERLPVRPLPAEERLLEDRPEHRIERTGFDREAYVRAGFTMPVPELLYNRGEIHNLSVERGTLTPEERFKINEHVIQTLKMLERLPLPEGMKRIPEYAGTHHERMDGGGYPRSLKAEELSIPARVMAIADIFEALTASDRPYKKGKKLSVTLKIMAGMARDGHIDPRLFRLFIRSGVYREYAENYLKAKQIDEVKMEEILKSLDEKKSGADERT